MARYCYEDTLSNFLNERADVWIEQMQREFDKQYGLPIDDSQVNAWKDCFKVLKNSLPQLNNTYSEFQIIFEYELSETLKRPDVILEFKMMSEIKQPYIDQAAAYGRDIIEYHVQSREKKVLPFLVMTKAKGFSEKRNGVVCCAGDNLCKAIAETISNSGNTVSHCNMEEWVNSLYVPLPSMVEAARRIWDGEELPYIRTVSSTSIPAAMEYLLNLTVHARKNNKHTIVFVTGVPIAGQQ